MTLPQEYLKEKTRVTHIFISYNIHQPGTKNTTNTKSVTEKNRNMHQYFRLIFLATATTMVLISTTSVAHTGRASVSRNSDPRYPSPKDERQ